MTANKHQSSLFVKVIGHELKQPLSSLKACLYMIKKKMDGDPKKAHEYIEKADKQIDSLAAMLNDLTDITKISLKQFEVEPREQLIEPIIAQLLADLYAINKKRTINLSMSDSKLKAEVDSLRFRQALMNVLTNAIRYSEPSSQIDVEVTQVGESVRIRVIDRGEGIDRKDIDRVFDPYFRTKQGYQYKSLGLGLSIAKEIVKRHGGEIVISSKEGKGTTVELNYPI